MKIKPDAQWEFTDKRRRPLAINFSADGSTLLISRDGLLQVVDLATGKVVAHKHKRVELARAALSLDGTRLAYGQKRLLVVANTGKTLVEHKIPDKQGVESLQWTRGGELLVTLKAVLVGGRNELLLLDPDGAIVRRGELVDEHPARAALHGKVVHVASYGVLRAYAFSGEDTFAPGASTSVTPLELIETKQGTVVHTSSKDHHHFGLLDAKLSVKSVVKVAGRVATPVALMNGGEHFAFRLSRDLVVFSKNGKPQRCPSPVEFADRIALSKTHLAVCDFLTVLVFEFETPLS